MAEDAFLNGCPEFRAKLIDASRELTKKVLLESEDANIFNGPQTATTKLKIKELALDDNKDIKNLVDAVNVIGYVDRAGGGGGGHADNRALRHFANGLGMKKLEVVREVVVEDETLLMAVDGLSTPLAGVSMVMWQPGHWSAIASNVSPSCKYVDDRSLPLTDPGPHIGFYADSALRIHIDSSPDSAPGFHPFSALTLIPPHPFTHRKNSRPTREPRGAGPSPTAC